MALWTVDKGLLRLRAQVDALAPGRSKASDGTIGDAAHAATDSDHNPEHPPPPGNPDYQVDALDLTHDPAHGADMAVIAEAIRVSRDRRVSYVIFNRRIYSGSGGPQPWVWRPYTGASAHTEHMHVSVRDDHHDEIQDWAIGATMTEGFEGIFARGGDGIARTHAQKLQDVHLVARFGTTFAGQPNWLVDKLNAIEAKPATVVLTPQDRAAIVADLLAALSAEIRDAVADLGEGGAAQVRADAGP